MRNFLQGLPNAKIAYNFHAYGPYFIYPFTYETDQNTMLET